MTSLCRPIWLFLCVPFVLSPFRATILTPAMAASSVAYSLVPGFFIQDNLTTADAIPPRFGLIDSSDNRWINLQEEVKKLNEESPANERYKLIFFGRHGEGFHNVAEAKYGTPAWDAYWSELNGDGEIVWGPDAELTPTGIEQARAVNAAWNAELKFNIPLPRKRYSSPMTRALSTYVLTFDGIDSPECDRPLVLENLREVYGVHTCDKRRSRTYIEMTFREFNIEPGFTEEDELWTPNVREPSDHTLDRARSVLDVIFRNLDDAGLVSVTAHSGIINGFSGAVGRPSFSLQTGGVLPMVVKALKTPSG
ncbi:putative phosphoglycerate mutase pmu1 [Marasmius sp. AFHP31]|nr:putative phosphoglycerate mutase pmu1 [Marasmius sp. AFHP31]